MSIDTTELNKFISQNSTYQIDFSVADIGQRIKTSKRLLTWRVGFSNFHALEAGQIGEACRGEEHEIVFLWTVTSGKRFVTVDGEEINASKSRSSMFQFGWRMRCGTHMEIICHASASLAATPGFRQYDLKVNGQSFATLLKMFEIGSRGYFPRTENLTVIQQTAPQPHPRLRRQRRSEPRRQVEYDNDSCYHSASRKSNEDKRYDKELDQASMALSRARIEAVKANEPPPHRNQTRPVTPPRSVYEYSNDSYYHSASRKSNDEDTRYQKEMTQASIALSRARMEAANANEQPQPPQQNQTRPEIPQPPIGFVKVSRKEKPPSQPQPEPEAEKMENCQLVRRPPPPPPPLHAASPQRKSEKQRGPETRNEQTYPERKASPPSPRRNHPHQEPKYLALPASHKESDHEPQSGQAPNTLGGTLLLTDGLPGSDQFNDNPQSRVPQFKEASNIPNRPLQLTNGPSVEISDQSKDDPFSTLVPFTKDKEFTPEEMNGQLVIKNWW